MLRKGNYMPKLNLNEIAHTLESNGLLYDQFLLSPAEREEVKRQLSDPEKVKLSRKEHMSKFSVIKAENGDLFAVYNPKIHNPRNNALVGEGMHAVIKAAQNIETGEWVALKQQEGFVQGEEEEVSKGKAEIAQAQAERKYLGKRQALRGAQKRTKLWSRKEVEIHYIFMDIVPGVQLYGGVKDKSLRDFVPDMSKEDLLTLYLNILQGLKELKDQNIIHRDLHHQNILVDVDNNYKVNFIDWGSAVDSRNGLWRGHNHTDPSHLQREINFRNGVDVEKALYGLYLIGHDFPETKRTLEEIFGKGSDPNAIWNLVGDQKAGYNTVDLDPWINKIKAMLKEKASVDAQITDTPLIAAAKENNLRDVLLLLQDKISIRSQLLDQDSTGKTALHYLAQQDESKAVIEILKLAGEKAMLVVDNEGNTPCHLLAQAGISDTLRSIDNEFSQSVLGRNTSGSQTMLNNACLQQNNEGLTPLMIALLNHPDNNDLIRQLSKALNLQSEQNFQIRSFARAINRHDLDQIKISLEEIKSIPSWNSEVDFMAELAKNNDLSKSSNLSKRK